MLGNDSSIKRALGYRRFTGTRPLRVMVLTSGYHLQKEACRALCSLGHEAFEVNVRVGGPGEVIRLLIHSMLRVRPDFLLLINHIGFDDRGGVGDLLQWLNMPLAVWYVDNPFFVIKNMQFPAPRMSSVFLWERSMVSTLQRSNVQDISYLPLGCDLSLFRGQSQPVRYPVSFVGNSMVHADEKWSRNMSGRTLALAKAWRRELVAKRQPMAERVLALKAAEPELPVWDMLASATFSATGIYRRRLLEALDSQSLHVFGDEHWWRVLPHASRHGLVPYGRELADVYRHSGININATSLQMPEAVNQRVFDVPAAGGFLLTDEQTALPELFEPGTEVVTYASAAHLADLCRYYAARPQERARIVQRAQARLLDCHTYAHRLQTLVAHMQRRHGAHVPVAPRKLAAGDRPPLAC